MQLRGGGCYRVQQDAGKDGVTSVRFFVCALGLVALAMSQMSRVVLHQSITQMVDQDSISHAQEAGKNSADGSCPWPEVADIKVEMCPSTDSLAVESTTEANSESEIIEAVIATSTTTESPDNASDEPGAIDTKQLQDDGTKSLSVLAQPHNQNDLNQYANADSGHDNPERDTQTTSTVEVIGQFHDNHQAGAANDSTMITTPVVYSYPRYKWSVAQQNVLLGSFFYSYLVFMILGGRIAEIYGAKYVLMLAVAGSAVINLSTPWLADTSYLLLLASRVAMGVIQAGVQPGVYALLAKWLTMSERSIFAPLMTMNLRLGIALGSMIPGFVSDWPNVFYLVGILSVVWSLIWWAVATSDPATNRWVSEGELTRINRKKQNQQPAIKPQSFQLKTVKDVQNGTAKFVNSQQSVSRSTPWLRLITAPSVIALIIGKLTLSFSLDFLSIELPSYLKFVHHASKSKISAITSNMFLLQVFLIVFVGWLAKIAVQRRPFGMSKTGVRKLFQGIASFGVSMTLFLLTFNDCDMTYMTILLLAASFLSMFTSGGETMLPYDLSEEYPATIMAIANSVAKSSPIATTILTPIVLGDQASSYDRWNMIIYIVASLNLVGALLFTFLVKAEPIKLTNCKVEDKKQARPDIDLEASKT